MIIFFFVNNLFYFYGFKYFKIGHSMQIGIINIDFNKYSGFSLLFTPIIFQYTL
jgi:hypothetical protein